METGCGHFRIQKLMRLLREDAERAAESLSLAFRREPGVEVDTGDLSGHY